MKHISKIAGVSYHENEKADVTINTERVGFEGAVKLVEDYIKIKYPDFNIKCTNTGSTQEA